MILLTGATGLLGHYLQRELTGHEIVTLGRSEGNDILCDLAIGVPLLPAERQFDLVVHAAGTRETADAMAVNLEGTRNLLTALESAPPRRLVIVSSYEVYHPESGENVTEADVRWAEDPAGRSKALAEAEATHWADRHGTLLTIVRPARMFGCGMRGEMARMFSEVLAGRYVHIRGEEGRLSIVTAHDVAKAIPLLSEIGGTYNLADGNPVSWLELAEAMSANAGKYRRPMTLPAAWASAARRWLGFVPAVAQSLDPTKLEMRSRRFTLDNTRACEAGISFFNTLEVIRREAEGYPYEES